MKFNSYFLIAIIVTIIISSCEKKTVITIPIAIGTIEWTIESSLPDYLRTSANVFETEDKVYLLPGKGCCRYSRVPQIMSYDGSDWSYEFDYDRHAVAGSSGLWNYGNHAYIIGGSNGQFHPTNSIIKLDVFNKKTSHFKLFPHGNIRAIASCNTSRHGFISINYDRNKLHPIYKYEFDLDIWDSIPSPLDKIYLTSQMVSKGDSIYIIYPDEEHRNFYTWNKIQNKWTPLADFPGEQRVHSIFKQFKNYLIFGTGSRTGTSSQNNQNLLSDIWLFDLSKSEWRQIDDYKGKAFQSGFSFVLKDKIYMGGGVTDKVSSPESLNGEMWSVRID